MDSLISNDGPMTAIAIALLLARVVEQCDQHLGFAPRSIVAFGCREKGPPRNQENKNLYNLLTLTLRVRLAKLCHPFFT